MMWPFLKNKLTNEPAESKENSTAIASIINSSADAFAKIHGSGQYPLALLASGLASLIVGLCVIWKTSETVSTVLPWLVGFGSLLAILGLIQQIFERWLQQQIVEKSLENYHALVLKAFDKYLSSRSNLEDTQWNNIMAELHKVYTVPNNATPKPPGTG